MAVRDFGWVEWCLVPLLPYMLLMACTDFLLDIFSGWVSFKDEDVDLWHPFDGRRPGPLTAGAE
jgi:hypothetical protein